LPLLLVRCLPRKNFSGLRVPQGAGILARTRMNFVRLAGPPDFAMRRVRSKNPAHTSVETGAGRLRRETSRAVRAAFVVGRASCRHAFACACLAREPALPSFSAYRASGAASLSLANDFAC